jgi:hypothetical protein
MTSGIIKALLFNYYRYTRQVIYIADEVSSTGGEIADILLIKNRSHEIEIKISLSDLKKDIEKRKHHFIKIGLSHTDYFSFCVTRELKDKAIEIINQLNPKYGLLIAHDIKYYRHGDNISHFIHIEKKAGLLKKNERITDQIIKDRIIARLASALSVLYSEKYIKEVSSETQSQTACCSGNII